MAARVRVAGRRADGVGDGEVDGVRRASRLHAQANIP